MTPLPRGLATFGKLLRLGLQVGGMDGASVQHRSAIDRAADQWEGELTDRAKWDRAVVGDEVEAVAVHAIAASNALHRRAALSATASSTG
jgi:hypothetical protein